ERMIGEQRVDRVEERESAVEVIYLRPAQRRRLHGVEERGAVVLKSRNHHCAVSGMRTDRLRLRGADARIERRPSERAAVEAIKPTVVAEVEAVGACGIERDRVLIAMRSAAGSEHGPIAPGVG